MIAYTTDSNTKSFAFIKHNIMSSTMQGTRIYITFAAD